MYFWTYLRLAYTQCVWEELPDAGPITHASIDATPNAPITDPAHDDGHGQPLILFELCVEWILKDLSNFTRRATLGLRSQQLWVSRFLPRANGSNGHEKRLEFLGDSSLDRRSEDRGRKKSNGTPQ
jgi:hypothetical protein